MQFIEQGKWLSRGLWGRFACSMPLFCPHRAGEMPFYATVGPICLLDELHEWSEEGIVNRYDQDGGGADGGKSVRYRTGQWSVVEAAGAEVGQEVFGTVGLDDGCAECVNQKAICCIWIFEGEIVIVATAKGIPKSIVPQKRLT